MKEDRYVMDFHKKPLGCKGVTRQNIGQCYLQFADRESLFQLVLDSKLFDTSVDRMLSILHSNVFVCKNPGTISKDYDSYAYDALELLNILKPADYSLFELAVLYVLYQAKKSAVGTDVVDTGLCISLFVPGEGYGVFDLPEPIASVSAIWMYHVFCDCLINPKILVANNIKCGMYNDMSDDEYDQLLAFTENNAVYFDGDATRFCFRVAVSVMERLKHTVGVYNSLSYFDSDLGLRK